MRSFSETFAAHLAGEATTPTSVARSRADGIATVFQETHLSPHLTVAENVMIGHEVRRWVGILAI